MTFNSIFGRFWIRKVYFWTFSGFPGQAKYIIDWVWCLRGSQIYYRLGIMSQGKPNILYASRPDVKASQIYYICIQTGFRSRIILYMHPDRMSGEAKYIIDWVWCLRGSQIYYGLGMMSQGRPHILLTNIII